MTDKTEAMNTTDTIERALVALSDRDQDRASMQNGVGFNGRDTDFGNSLADQIRSGRTLTPKQAATAHKMLRIYKRQLATYGIDYDNIPVPVAHTPVPETRKVSREVSTTRAAVETKPVQGSVKVDGTTAIVTFGYSADLVAQVKSFPGRRWNPADKTWQVPVADPTVAASVKSWALGLGFTVEGDFEVESLVEESRATDADLDIEGFGTDTLSPMPFQKAGIAYAVKAKRTFIADQMGLGKTVQALGAIAAANAYPAVVVCPATVKFTWRDHVQAWLPGRSVQVVHGTKPQPISADVIVINYDILKHHAPTLSPKAVVLDESHYVKSSKAQRTKAAEKLAKGAEYVFALTGTPVVNRPVELVAQLKVMDRLKDFGGWKAFVTRYCDAYQGRFGWDVSGATNLDELNERLRSMCYVRRTKAEVIDELPEKRRAQVAVEGSAEGLKAYREAEADIIDFLARRAAELAAELGEDPESAAVEAALRAEAAEHLVRFTTLKRLAATAKLDAAKAWVEDFIESTTTNGTGAKLIVFAHHVDVIKELAAAFDAPMLVGGMTDEAKHEVVRRFQEDPTVRIVVCGIKVAGVGLTMTAASDMLFVEQGWTPAEHDQAEDRAYARLSDLHGLTAWYMLLDQSIDQAVWNLIGSKRVVVDAATEGGEVTETSIIGDLVVAMSRR